MTIETTLVSDDVLNTFVNKHAGDVKLLSGLVEHTNNAISTEYATLYAAEAKDMNDEDAAKLFKGYVTTFLEHIRSEVYALDIEGETPEIKAERILNINRAHTVVAKLYSVEINVESLVVDFVVVDVYQGYYRQMKEEALAKQDEDIAAFDCKMSQVDANPEGLVEPQN